MDYSQRPNFVFTTVHVVALMFSATIAVINLG